MNKPELLIAIGALIALLGIHTFLKLFFLMEP